MLMKNKKIYTNNNGTHSKEILETAFYSLQAHLYADALYEYPSLSCCIEHNFITIKEIMTK